MKTLRNLIVAMVFIVAALLLSGAPIEAQQSDCGAYTALCQEQGGGLVPDPDDTYCASGYRMMFHFCVHNITEQVLSSGYCYNGYCA